jgi:hypothetical protein
MFSALSALWAWRKTVLWAGLALTIGILWWRNGSLAEQRDAARLDSDRWKLTADANAKAVDDLKAAHTRAMEAVERVSAESAKRSAVVTTIREEISRAPDTSSCGPAVAVAVDGLRSLLHQQPTGDPD